MKRRALGAGTLVVFAALPNCILPPATATHSATAGSPCMVAPRSASAAASANASAPPGVKPTGTIIFDGNSLDVQNVKPGGSWFAMSDDTAKGLMTPPPKGDFASAFAKGVVHTQGKGFKDWGGGIGLNFVESEPLSAVDASAYTGISVKLSGSTPVYLAVSTTATMPEFGRCRKCYDHFVALISNLSGEPKVYTFGWSQLKADGWGEPEAKLDPKQIVGLNFTSKGPTAWDFNVHAISFTQ